MMMIIIIIIIIISLLQTTTTTFRFGQRQPVVAGKQSSSLLFYSLLCVCVCRSQNRRIVTGIEIAPAELCNGSGCGSCRRNRRNRREEPATALQKVLWSGLGRSDAAACCCWSLSEFSLPYLLSSQTTTAANEMALLMMMQKLKRAPRSILSLSSSVLSRSSSPESCVEFSLSLSHTLASFMLIYKYIHECICKGRCCQYSAARNRADGRE